MLRLAGAGEMVSIMGASGSGKSTLMNVLGLLDGYDAGACTLNSQLMKDLSETRTAVHRRDDVLAVKESLLQFDKDEVFVEVETNPQPFERRKVKTGLSDGVTIEIVDGRPLIASKKRTVPFSQGWRVFKTSGSSSSIASTV